MPTPQLRHEEFNENRRREERLRNIEHNARIRAAEEKEKGNNKRIFSFSRLFRSPKTKPVVELPISEYHGEQLDNSGLLERTATPPRRVHQAVSREPAAARNHRIEGVPPSSPARPLATPLHPPPVPTMVNNSAQVDEALPPDLSSLFPGHSPISFSRSAQNWQLFRGSNITLNGRPLSISDSELSDADTAVEGMSVTSEPPRYLLVEDLPRVQQASYTEPFQRDRDISSSSSQQNRSGSSSSIPGTEESQQIETTAWIPVVNADGVLSYRHISNDVSVVEVPIVMGASSMSLTIQQSLATMIGGPPQLSPEQDPKTYGWELEHRLFEDDDEEPVVACRVLGHGSLGIVDEVRRRNTTLPTFVRKRVQLSARKAQAKATLNIIQKESENLKSLVHPHIVTLLGTYEEMRHTNRHLYFLLMSPVGDNDLKNFLNIAGDQLEQDMTALQTDLWRGWIYHWFTCLASALAYMHDNGIRHQDIKPSNIIHRGEKIYFTDFSSSCAFDLGHTTSTENPSRSSPMYAAPEIIDKYNGNLRRHGRASDIFALGCVFCDMLTVLTGRPVSSFHDALSNDNTESQEAGHYRDPLHYSHKISSIYTWFGSSHIFATHISDMLNLDRPLRPTALVVVQGLVRDHIFDDACTCWVNALWYKNNEGVLVRRNFGTKECTLEDGTTELVEVWPHQKMVDVEQHGIKSKRWSERVL
ncbi:Nn.00g031600.m01.CDS01 [Neocucurbitaria sp. VM-36]